MMELDELYVMARRVLLDALGDHRDAVAAVTGPTQSEPATDSAFPAAPFL
jgi:hypothetical protein